ncbi:MAG: DUF2232 domain-containing protein [Bacteriovoracaceae bacterium]|jgi:hypothetical protein|nr:DUF2232 domain-containing protein [Bacteriovoracaceae bacterium]
MRDHIEPNEIKDWSGTQNGDQSFSRFIFLGVFSIFLNATMFMSVFASFPIALSFIMYGRNKGITLSVVGLFASTIIGFKVLASPFIPFTYLFAAMVGVGISEIIKRGISPIKGMMKLGGVITVLFSLLSVGAIISSDGDFKEQLKIQVELQSKKLLETRNQAITNGSEENLKFLDLLETPDVLTELILQALPASILMGIFFWIWVNLYLILRSQRTFFIDKSYLYSDRELLNFKVPEYFIIFVIVALVFTLFGDYFTPSPEIVGGTKDATAWGQSLLKCLGLFYFFQGMGIYIDFLDFLKISGFLRMLLILFTVITGSWVVALVGLFDMWVDFKKFFKTKKGNSN